MELNWIRLLPDEFCKHTECNCGYLYFIENYHWYCLIHSVKIEKFFCFEKNAIFLLGRLSSSEQEEPLCLFLCYFILFWFLSFNLFLSGKINLCHLNFESSLELAVATNMREASITNIIWLVVLLASWYCSC